MKHIPFYNHLNEYVSINEIEYEKIIGYFEYKSFKKKDLLLEIDNKNINMFFIIKGCLHMYFITEKGIKKTVQIAIENWWLTDLISFRKNFKSEFNIQAIEKSEVLSLTQKNYDVMLCKHQNINSYFRNIYEIALGASTIRIKHLYNYSKEELYLSFIKKYPSFIQRVPQYIIASFLGLSQEYVSEIRAKRGI